MQNILKNPVTYIIFNRSDCARQTFAKVREARPEKVYLIADGPRHHKEGEAAKCAETRRVVEDMIDWPCKVHKDYANTNMGCGKRIISGLNHVFENEENAIILEDDILVDSSFFPFCQELLQRYQNEEKVMQISGYNPFYYRANGSDYFFSRYAGIWGWATWRRAWEAMHGLDTAEWQKIKQEQRMHDWCLSAREAKLRTQTLDRIFSDKQNTWAARWSLARNMQLGIGVVPCHNLTKNIGFSGQSTNTINPFNRNRFARLESVQSPFRAPAKLECDSGYDHIYNRKMYSIYVYLRTLLWNIVQSTR